MFARVLLLAAVTAMACVPGVFVVPPAVTAADSPWTPADWQPVVGDWTFDDGHYIQHNHELYGAWSLYTPSKFTDVDVITRFKIEKLGSGVQAAGIVFRAVDDQHFYYAHFDSRNNQLIVIRWSDGETHHRLRVHDIGLHSNQWHTARVHCVDDRARVYLDGRLLGTADGISRVEGRVGVRAGQGKVRFADFQATGHEVSTSEPEALPWWNSDWQYRVPVVIEEPGIDDRQRAIARVRADFGGRAHWFETKADAEEGWSDIAVIDAAGNRLPAKVTPVELVQQDDHLMLDRGDVRFPVSVGWCSSSRFMIYFGNPEAGTPEAHRLESESITFAGRKNELPRDWRFVGGTWKLKQLTRPKRKQHVVAAVESQRHVAFPGICRTKQGTLLVIYRQGYSHASGKPDDGQIMLVRSHDKGKTWSQPELVYDDPTIDDRNAAIACMDDGTIVAIFDKYGRRDELSGHHWAWLITSSDEGHTWSEPMKISKTRNVHTRSPVLDLGDGRWLVPYSESTNSPTAATFFSVYDPKTKQFEEIAVTPRGQRNIADEVCVTRAANGDLVALIRSNVDPELFQLRSTDNGKTWSEPRMNGIPSQFTPADLITLSNGWLLASFSFRERRNERAVASRDHGHTWDVENSVSLFDGTMRTGGDRSYPASVQLDEQTIGTVLYETRTPPVGGHIWFVTTPISQFEAPKEETLYQGDADAEATFALWPDDLSGKAVDFSYRFTGKFGVPPNRVGILLSFNSPANYTSLEYQMGVDSSRRSPTNHVVAVACTDGVTEQSRSERAHGDWFNDGVIHRLGVRHGDDIWTMTIDGIDQIAVPTSLGQPRGIVVRRAAVAVYDVNTSDQPVQLDPRPLESRLGDLQEQP